MNFPQYIGPWTNPKPAFGVNVAAMNLHHELARACEDYSSDPERCKAEAKRRQDAAVSSGTDLARVVKGVYANMNAEGWYDLKSEGDGSDPYGKGGDSILPEWLAGDEEDAGLLIPILAGSALGLLAFFGLILRRKR